MDWLSGVMENNIFVLCGAVVLGLMVGRIQFWGISLGVSGTLFTGLGLGMLGYSVPYEYFSWNLVVFVVAVGLLASQDILRVVARFGFRFVALGILVTAVGAVLTVLLGGLFSASGVHPLMVAGSYTGALTSSPGLGAALEATGGHHFVTIGYTIAYPFGVIAVVLFVHLAPAIFRLDLDGERKAFKESFDAGGRAGKGDGSSRSFALLSFVVCMAVGVVFGSIPIPIPGVGVVSLGTTGGALIIALLFGAMERVGPLRMRMDRATLSAFRSFSLAFFLAVVGLMAGPELVEAFGQNGVAIMTIGFFAAVGAMLAGFLVGRYVFRINWILLAGALCGAMTSTPGLGAAIDATGEEECAAGYGAAYPVAILCMVIFTKIIAGGRI